MPYKAKRAKKPPIDWRLAFSHPGPGVLEPAGLESVQEYQLDGARWALKTFWADRNGRLEPVSVEVRALDSDRMVQADLIRRIPIGTLQAEARADGAGQAEAFADAVAKDPELTHLLEPWTGVAGPARYVDAEWAGQFAKLSAHRGVAASDAEIEEVARVYMQAWGLGLPVTAAVAAHFGIAKSTAAKRIMAARKAGLLDQAKRITR